jgi:uroporphyrinogen decarboxylase
MPAMTHRERVLTALRHQEPDRVPMDLWGSDSRLLNQFYFKVLDHLGWKGTGEKVRPGKTAEYVDYRLSDYLDTDFRHLVIGKPKNFQKYTDRDGNIFDEWGVGSQKIGEYTTVTSHPLREPEIAAIAKHRWPAIADPGRIEGLAAQARHWHEHTDYCITTTAPLSGVILELYQYLRGTEELFTDLHLYPKFAEALIEKIAEVVAELYVYFVTPVAPYITWVEFATDFGSQHGPLVSPALYRKFFQQPMARIFQAVKRAAPQARIFLHSCGSVRRLIPDFIETGVEILSAIQPLARDMNSAELKREFGQALVFHGGIDLQRALTGTLAEAIRETKSRIADYAPGGGYIAGPSNHFTSDVPVENFFALYQTAREFGTYPLPTKI